MNCLSIDRLNKQYGIKTILNDLSFGMSQGQKIGLVGANGSGKSTLLRIIMDLEKPDSGTVHRNNSIVYAYLNQEPHLKEDNTVFQEVLEECSEELALLEEYHELSANLTDERKQLERLERLQENLESLQCWDLENRVKQYLNQVGITNLSRKISTLSGGERKKIALARLFINKADFLLLDEPTNHLDTKTIEWLEDMLCDFEGSLLLVTHDRYFLTRVTDGIADLRQGSIKFYPGDYQRYLHSVSHEANVQFRTQKNSLSFIRRELQWVEKMPRARGTKSASRLRRFDQAEEDVIQTKAMTLKPLEEFQFGLHRKLGNTILEWGQLGKKYTDWLFRNSSHKVLENERIGIIGRNGAGKSTFIRLFLGETKPDEGWIKKGIHTEFCYFDQERLALDEAHTVLESLQEFGDTVHLENQRIHISAYLEKFQFPRETFKKKVKLLSGGEKARLLLAKLVGSRGNFLVLDEPTNDLDLDTLRILEEAICAYQGCAFIVSHDRYFLDRTCNAILEIGEEDPPLYSSGNYSFFQNIKSRRKLLSTTNKDIEVEKRERPKRDRKLFGNKETRELEEIEPKISHLEKMVNDLEERLGQPLDAEEYKPLWDKLNATRMELEESYKRWEILESLKEQQ